MSAPGPTPPTSRRVGARRCRAGTRSRRPPHGYCRRRRGGCRLPVRPPRSAVRCGPLSRAARRGVRRADRGRRRGGAGGCVRSPRPPGRRRPSPAPARPRGPRSVRPPWDRPSCTGRCPLGRVRPEHAVEPSVLADGESVPGLVEHERVRVRRQHAGQSEPAVRTARQGAEAFVPRVHQFHGFEDFVGTADRDARGGTQHAEVSADRSGGMAGHATQQNADLTGGMRDAVQRTAPEVSDAAPRSEFGHEAERCRPARARRSEQHGDAPRGRLEGDVVDGGRKLLAGAAGRPDGLDHPKQDSAPYRIFRAPQRPLPTGRTPPSNPCSPSASPRGRALRVRPRDAASGG